LSWPLRFTHIWYFKGVPSRLVYLLDLAPKDLEKIIYFAAYVDHSVNDEQRHNDLPTLENEMGVERKRVEQRRDADLEARAQKLEADVAELEAEGAKSDVRRKVKEGGEREMRQLRDRAQRELDRLDEIWTTFASWPPAADRRRDALPELYDRTATTSPAAWVPRRSRSRRGGPAPAAHGRAAGASPARRPPSLAADVALAPSASSRLRRPPASGRGPPGPRVPTLLDPLALHTHLVLEGGSRLCRCSSFTEVIT